MRLAAFLALCAAATILAAPAGATPQQDFRYCSALEHGGMEVTDCAMASAVAMGQCGHFDIYDRTWRDAMNTTRDMWGYSATESATILVNAVQIYCPWNVGKLPHP